MDSNNTVVMPNNDKYKLGSLKTEAASFGTWQPIETAPRDGTYVIVWPPTWTGVTSCAAWDSDSYANRPCPHWRRVDDVGIYVSKHNPPTHWMPKPAPPLDDRTSADGKKD